MLTRTSMHGNRPKPTETDPSGFALVATLALMILLTLVAVGLLSLSAISLRGSTQSQARSEAQANARLALMIAIGELQKQLGPDQRISANGAILSDSAVNHPHWTGVWNSWKAGTGEASQHSTIGNQPDSAMRPNYEANRSDYFRSWLLSLDPAEAINVKAAGELALTGTRMPGPYNPNDPKPPVELVGQGSLGNTANASDKVSARLLDIKPANGPARGRYAWWVGDESQKARVMDDSHQSNPDTSLASKLSRQQSPGSMGTRTIKGLKDITNDLQLSGIPSLATLDVVSGVTGRPSQNFHHVTPFSQQVLADVREGGLKRDLSTLLERTINPGDTGDAFMLYKFDTKDQWMTGPDNQEAVPIQDIASYYQLYDGSRSGRKEGLRYSSELLNNGMQVVSPNYGVRETQNFQREYTNLYRQPVPVKVQFLLSFLAQPISQPPPSDPNGDSHLLLVGFTPSVTFWNPTNLPMVMRFDANDPDFNAIALRFGTLPARIRVIKNNAFTSNWMSLPDLRGTVDGNKPELFNLYFSGKRSISFQPGEVKTFSLPFAGDVSNIKNSAGFSNSGAAGQGNNMRNFWFKTDKFFEPHEVIAGWEPRSFMLFNRSASSNDSAHVLNGRLKFKGTDSIRFEVDANNTQMGNGDTNTGGAFYMHMIQSNYADPRWAAWERRHYVLASRQGNAASGSAHGTFNKTLFTKGFPDESPTISASGRSGSNIISRSNSREGWPFLQFSLQAGVETHENSNGGIAGGRKFASRPFLHSSPIAAHFIDDSSGNSLYNNGWNWSVNEINEVFEAPVQTNPDNIQQGYYGGGYTPEFGTTNLIQLEIPAAPPISIAALSHARLGGYSIANQGDAISQSNQAITATGQAGLFPHTIQAIGNSYAHPLLSANKAFDTANRTFKADQGTRQTTFADHSYLANKALWDEFFFSSITPQPSSVKAFGGANRTTKQVADDFFFNDKPLPNRRINPFKRNLDQTRLDALLAKADDFQNGMADQIAAHLMMEGPFNINSTSVDAWKTLLASLKGKPVAYLDKAQALAGVINPDTVTPDGTPVSSFTMPNARPADGSDDPQDPEQWLSWRELSDSEITQLATAIVKQVKLRGPFLSLSEFVNRRLDASNRDLSLKGALQAALDDPQVSINEGFRNNTRKLDKETGTMSPAFPEALEGPIAYGSAAYVDQADILRNISSQITPRGDTFVIHSYGDSLDNSGRVLARAWCEAVVQRTPVYSDPSDEPYIKQAELTSYANKLFGRKFDIVTFRWLNPDEV